MRSIRVLFDPITNGHLSLLRRGLQIFDKIVLAIAINPRKKPLFTLEERVDILKTVLKDYSRVEIDHFQGLLVDYVQKRETNIVLRGLRALSDFEYEFQSALMNRKLSQKVETVFMMTDYDGFTSVRPLSKRPPPGGKYRRAGSGNSQSTLEREIRIASQASCR